MASRRGQRELFYHSNVLKNGLRIAVFVGSTTTRPTNAFPLRRGFLGVQGSQVLFDEEPSYQQPYRYKEGNKQRERKTE